MAASTDSIPLASGSQQTHIQISPSITALSASDAKARRAAAERLTKSTAQELQTEAGSSLAESMTALVRSYDTSPEALVKSAASRTLAILASTEACEEETIRATGAIRALLGALNAKEKSTRELAGGALAKLLGSDAGRQALIDIPQGITTLIKAARATEGIIFGIDENEINVAATRAIAVFCNSDLGREAIIREKTAISTLIIWFSKPKSHQMHLTALQAVANLCKSDRGIQAFVAVEHAIRDLTNRLDNTSRDRDQETLFQVITVFLAISKSEAGLNAMSEDSYLFDVLLRSLKFPDPEIKFMGYQVLRERMNPRKHPESKERSVMEGLVSLVNSGDERMEKEACDLILKLLNTKGSSDNHCPKEYVSIDGLVDALFVALKFDYAQRAIRALKRLVNSEKDLAIISQHEGWVQKLSQLSISDDIQEQEHVLYILSRIGKTRPDIILEPGYIHAFMTCFKSSRFTPFYDALECIVYMPSAVQTPFLNHAQTRGLFTFLIRASSSNHVLWLLSYFIERVSYETLTDELISVSETNNINLLPHLFACITIGKDEYRKFAIALLKTIDIHFTLTEAHAGAIEKAFFDCLIRATKSNRQETRSIAARFLVHIDSTSLFKMIGQDKNFAKQGQEFAEFLMECRSSPSNMVKRRALGLQIEMIQIYLAGKWQPERPGEFVWPAKMIEELAIRVNQELPQQEAALIAAIFLKLSASDAGIAVIRATNGVNDVIDFLGTAFCANQHGSEVQSTLRKILTNLGETERLKPRF